MFDDCGDKLKGFAMGYFVLCCISAVIGGIAVMVEDMFFLGLCIILGGIAVSYITALVIAAFGDLVTTSEATARNTAALLQSKENPKESFYNKDVKTGVHKSAPTGGQSSDYVPAWKRVQQEGEE